MSANTHRIAPLLLSFCLLSCTLFQQDPSDASFKLMPEHTFDAPDKSSRVQLYGQHTENDFKVRIWVVDTATQKRTLLDEIPDNEYAAGFRYTPDSQWLVRMQKLGAGWHTVYLYHKEGDEFKPATKSALGDVAWNFLASQNLLKGKTPINHLAANLTRGLEENYHWMGVTWPENRYVVIGLTGSCGCDGPTIAGWKCRYDLVTKTFSVPDSFLEENAKAIRWD